MRKELALILVIVAVLASVLVTTSGIAEAEPLPYEITRDMYVNRHTVDFTVRDNHHVRVEVEVEGGNANIYILDEENYYKYCTNKHYHYEYAELYVRSVTIVIRDPGLYHLVIEDPEFPQGLIIHVSLVEEALPEPYPAKIPVPTKKTTDFGAILSIVAILGMAYILRKKKRNFL